MMIFKKKVSLALGSGAARGYAHIPIIQCLEKEGITIQSVSGSSIGALVGAYYCLHGEVDSLIEFTRTLTGRDMFKIIDINNPKKSIIKGERIKKFLDDNLFHGKNFSDLKKPLYICATDFFKKKAVYFSRGKLIDAVMASISLPGIFPLFEIKNNFYCDGGILDPIPRDVLFRNGAKKVISVSLSNYKMKKSEETKKLIPVVIHSLYFMMGGLVRRENDKKNFILEPPFDRKKTNPLNFREPDLYAKAGENEINAKIDKIKKWI